MTHNTHVQYRTHRKTTTQVSMPTEVESAMATASHHDGAAENNDNHDTNHDNHDNNNTNGGSNHINDTTTTPTHTVTTPTHTGTNTTPHVSVNDQQSTQSTKSITNMDNVVNVLTDYYAGLFLADTLVRRLLPLFDGYECKSPEKGKFTLAWRCVCVGGIGVRVWRAIDVCEGCVEGECGVYGVLLCVPGLSCCVSCCVSCYVYKYPHPASTPVKNTPTTLHHTAISSRHSTSAPPCSSSSSPYPGPQACCSGTPVHLYMMATQGCCCGGGYGCSVGSHGGCQCSASH